MTTTRLFLNAIVLTSLILLNSCGKSEREINEENQKAYELKEMELQTLNKKAINSLALKYKAISGWDTLYLWTLSFQEVFIDSGKLISFEGEIKDITKKDSSFILKVHNRISSYYNKDYLAEITINRKQLQQIQMLIKSKKHSIVGSFVFKVSKIISVNPELRSDFEIDGGDSYSYLDYDFDETLLIFKGEIIDFYLNEINSTYDE